MKKNTERTNEEQQKNRKRKSTRKVQNHQKNENFSRKRKIRTVHNKYNQRYLITQIVFLDLDTFLGNLVIAVSKVGGMGN